MKNKICIGFLIIVSALMSCKKQYSNLNGPVEDVILNDRAGLIVLSTSMKFSYATAALGSLYTTTGTTAREFKGTSTFISILEVEAGAGGLAANNGSVTNLWNNCYKVMGMADNIIAKAPAVIVDPALKSGILAHAYIFKALSIGALAVGFEKFPLETNANSPVPFVTREVALQTALNLLNEAKNTITATPPSAEFNTKVLGNAAGNDFSLINIINALTARYSLWLKKYPEAYAAANAVNLSIKSKFVYTTQGANPVNNISIIGATSKPRENFGLQTGLFDPTDARLNFYLATPNSTFGGENLKTIAGFYSTNSSDVPVYMPDEMRLIKAEAVLLSSTAIAGTTNPATVVAEINAVRQQTSGDIFLVHANLPAYTGASDAASLTTEIFRQRCAELFCSGNKLEDSRRLNRIASSTNLTERNRNFYPYPQQERDNNLNTPNDPVF